MRFSRTFSSVESPRTFWKGRSLLSFDCNISAFLLATFDDLVFLVASRILQLSSSDSPCSQGQAVCYVTKVTEVSARWRSVCILLFSFFRLLFPHTTLHSIAQKFPLSFVFPVHHSILCVFHVNSRKPCRMNKDQACQALFRSYCDANPLKSKA